jgi:hypothetical protein
MDHAALKASVRGRQKEKQLFSEKELASSFLSSLVDRWSGGRNKGDAFLFASPRLSYCLSAGARVADRPLKQDA